MKVKELQEKLVSNLKKWQKIENHSIVSTGDIMAKTDNPVIRLVMELIQHDSQFHHRVQQFIIDIVQKETVVLNPDELVEVWDSIEKHIEIEKNTINLAKEILTSLKSTKMVIPEYLLNYLMVDEKKHDKILEDLSIIKKGMYPYG